MKFLGPPLSLAFVARKSVFGAPFGLPFNIGCRVLGSNCIFTFEPVALVLLVFSLIGLP
jgi:hypothetical protein